MSGLKACIGAIVGCVFGSAVAYGQGLEPIPLRLYLNTADHGEYILMLGPQGELWVPEEAFNDMGIVAPVNMRDLEGGRYVSLKELTPAVQYLMDPVRATLYMQADPAWLRKRSVDLQAGSRRHAAPPALWLDSAFVNYGLNYYATESNGPRAIEVPLETVVNSHGVALVSNFQYRELDDVPQWSRLRSYAVHDDRAALRRWTIGDFSAHSGELGGGGLFGGVSVARNFGIDPYLITAPGPRISGVLETPSQVQLYVNDILVRSEDLPSGEFEVVNIAALHGAGRVRLVIRDAFGQERVSDISFYGSSRLLKRGLHDYVYGLGARRTNVVGETHYGDWSLLGRHDYGLTDGWSVGLRLEAAPSLLSLGTSSNVLLGTAGEVEIAGAYSRAGAYGGYAASAAYAYVSRRFHARISARHIGASYVNTSLPIDRDRARSQAFVGLGWHGPRLGSLSFTLTSTEYYRSDTLRTTSLVYSKRLARYASMLLRASKYLPPSDGTGGDEIALSFNFLLANQTASMGATTEPDATTGYAYVQKNPPLGEGYGYRLRTASRQVAGASSATDGEVYVQYNGPHGSYSADYDRAGELGAYRLTNTGSVVYVKDHWLFGRPIADSFALVRVGDLDGVRVLFGNQETGVTRRGLLLVPTLVSYSNNSLVLDAGDLPVNVSLKRLRQSFAPGYRNGAVAEFEATRVQAVTGRIFYVGAAKTRPVEFARLRLVSAGRTLEAAVGRGGEFYIENLPPGRIHAQVTLPEGDCELEFAVPSSGAMLLDVGEVQCRG